MVLNEVIELLIKIKEKHGGDIPVFVNGEHGEREPELSTDDHFSVGEADMTLGFDKGKIPDWLPPRNTAMQIGGY